MKRRKGAIMLREPICWYCGEQETVLPGVSPTAKRPDPLCYWEQNGVEAGWLHSRCALELYRALHQFPMMQSSLLIPVGIRISLHPAKKSETATW